MKLLRKGGYSREERELFQPVVFNDIIQLKRAVLEAMELLDTPLDDERALDHAQVVFAKDD
jgi:guanine nucleotide-binding protein G(i) subunit alpha